MALVFFAQSSIIEVSRGFIVDIFTTLTLIPSCLSRSLALIELDTIGPQAIIDISSPSLRTLDFPNSNW